MNSNIKARLFSALVLLLLCSIVLTILIPLSPAGQILPSRDSGVFLYTGWRVLHGEIPYLDIWDHKPPIIYYLDAIGLWMSSDSIWGVWLIEVFSLLIASIASFSIIKRLFGLYSAIVISFLWIYSAFYLLAGGNLTTEYPLPMQFGLLWFFYRAEKHRSYGWNGVILGLISGLIFFTRQNAIAIPVAIGFYLVLTRVYHREYGKLFKEALSIFAGAFLVSSVIIGYFAIKGALPAFWDIAFIYNFSYADEKDNVDRFNALVQGLNQLQNIGLAQFSFLGWGSALVLMLFKKDRIKADIRPFLMMSLLAFPLELWFVSIGGRPRIPYFLVLLPIFSVFAGFTFHLLFDLILKDVPALAMAFMVVMTIASFGFVFIADYAELAQNFMQPTGNNEIITYIQTHSESNDFVLMWGAEASYNFATRRPSPSRFVYQTPLYNEKKQDQTVEFLQKILENKPKLIVLRSADRLSDFRFGYRDNQIGSLMDQVKGRYQNSMAFGDWVVYSNSGN